MIKTVLLDLDDTIFDFKKAQKLALTRTLEMFGLEATQEVISRYDQINQYVWRMLEEGKMSREEILVKRYEMLLQEYHIQADPVKIQETYERELGVGHYYLDGAKEFLKALRKEYKLYLVSNGTAVVQDSRIASSDLGDYFEEIFISERVGANKPSIKFFEYVFARIPNFEKNETVIIGDSLTSDMKGGLNAGIHTIWFNPHGHALSGDIVPEYEAACYDKVEEILHQI